MEDDHRIDLLRPLLWRLVIGVELVGLGLGGYWYIDDHAYDDQLSTWLMVFIWIGSGAAIGAGFLLPFKWWSVAGAIVGVMGAFIVLAYFALMGI